ncbi:MAG: hypothetical protein ACJ0BN_05825 [Limisphaerales bacterium]
MKHFLLLSFVLGVIALALNTGCSTPDPDNTSARPWSQPRGWEHGLPTNIMEGR